jgi:PKD repeat protein
MCSKWSDVVLKLRVLVVVLLIVSLFPAWGILRSGDIPGQTTGTRTVYIDGDVVLTGVQKTYTDDVQINGSLRLVNCNISFPYVLLAPNASFELESSDIFLSDSIFCWGNNTLIWDDSRIFIDPTYNYIGLGDGSTFISKNNTLITTNGTKTYDHNFLDSSFRIQSGTDCDIDLTDTVVEWFNSTYFLSAFDLTRCDFKYSRHGITVTDEMRGCYWTDSNFEHFLDKCIFTGADITSENCSFKYVVGPGIEFYNKKLDVSNCTFFNTSLGVNALGGRVSDMNIRDCSFTDYDKAGVYGLTYGIYVQTTASNPFYPLDNTRTESGTFVIERNTIDGGSTADSSGIYIYGIYLPPGDEHDKVFINDNDISNHYNYAVSVRSCDIQFMDNDIHDNLWNHGGRGTRDPPIFFYDGSSVNIHSSEGSIVDNDFYDNDPMGEDLFVEYSGMVIKGNTFHRTGEGIFIRDAYGLTIEQNEFQDNYYGIFAFETYGDGGGGHNRSGSRVGPRSYLKKNEFTDCQVGFYSNRLEWSVINNTLTNCTEAVLIYLGFESAFSDNTYSSCEFAVNLSGNSNITFTDDVFDQCDYHIDARSTARVKTYNCLLNESRLTTDYSSFIWNYRDVFVKAQYSNGMNVYDATLKVNDSYGNVTEYRNVDLYPPYMVRLLHSLSMDYLIDFSPFTFRCEAVSGYWGEQTGDPGLFEVVNITLHSVNLKMRSLTVSDTHPVNGDLVDVVVKVENTGSSNLSMVRMDLELGETDLYEYMDLSPGQIKEFNYVWAARNGTHFFTAEIDALDTIMESDETDNLLAMNLTVFHRPVAHLSVTNNTPWAGNPIQFMGEDLEDGWMITGYLFDYGDGSSSPWIGSSQVMHPYSQIGIYFAKVKIKDEYGHESEWSNEVEINVVPEPEPYIEPVFNDTVVDFYVDPVGGTINTEFTFHPLIAIDKAGYVTTYSWDFGDGGTSILRDPVHQFSQDGLYKVRLTVTDSFGKEADICKSFTVSNLPPTAVLNISKNRGTTEEYIGFDASQSYDLDDVPERLEYHWDFGDGETSENITDYHRYKAKGTYIVTLTVTDDDGNTSTAQRTIIIDEEAKSVTSYFGFDLWIWILLLLLIVILAILVLIHFLYVRRKSVIRKQLKPRKVRVEKRKKRYRPEIDLSEVDFDSLEPPEVEPVYDMEGLSIWDIERTMGEGEEEDLEESEPDFMDVMLRDELPEEEVDLLPGEVAGEVEEEYEGEEEEEDEEYEEEVEYESEEEEYPEEDYEGEEEQATPAEESTPPEGDKMGESDFPAGEEPAELDEEGPEEEYPAVEEEPEETFEEEYEEPPEPEDIIQEEEADLPMEPEHMEEPQEEQIFHGEGRHAAIEDEPGMPKVMSHRPTAEERREQQTLEREEVTLICKNCSKEIDGPYLRPVISRGRGRKQVSAPFCTKKCYKEFMGFSS